MCPYKKVVTRKKNTPWLTTEIYRAIREKKILIKDYKKKRDSEILRSARTQRNKVNSLVNKAKTDYILRSLQINIKKPKKFWKVIKELIDGDECVDITSYFFKDPLTGSYIVKDETPDFLNHFFANIAERTRPRPNNHIERITDCYEDVYTEFNFVPPRVEDMYGYMMDIDVNSSSCIQGMNSRLCKVMLDKIPDKQLLYVCKFLVL